MARARPTGGMHYKSADQGPVAEAFCANRADSDQFAGVDGHVSAASADFRFDAAAIAPNRRYREKMLLVRRGWADQHEPRESVQRGMADSSGQGKAVLGQVDVIGTSRRVPVMRNRRPIFATS